MIDPLRIQNPYEHLYAAYLHPDLLQSDLEPLFKPGKSFTKSNGTTLSRIYERLTKASRRAAPTSDPWGEMRYRKGIYDAFTALTEAWEEGDH